MNTVDVVMVRIYLSERDGQLAPLLKRLHDREKLRGVTVFRGISGFGGSGSIHTAKIMDLSLDLPVVLEFYDTPDKVDAILGHLRNQVKPQHMVWWHAQMNME